MTRYILKRIMYMIFVFAIMSVILFSLYEMIPGDPARAEVEHLKTQLRPEEYERAYQQARKDWGLDDPIHEKYIRWAKGLLKGDLGYSHVHKKEVNALIKTPLKNTLFINFFSVTAGLLITIPLGVYCAINQHSKFDKAVQVLTIIGHSIPSFIFGLLFIFVFSVKLRWFPVSGMSTPNLKGSDWVLFKDKVWHLALPLMVMTISTLAGLTRYIRAAMIESLSMDYIKTARAKGLKEKVVIWSHAWRNALLPIITLLVSWFASIFYGSLIIESMFNLNGLGKFLIDALNNKDFNLVMAVQLLYIVVALLSNLITDISYGLVDPRVRVDR